jgi:alkylation response protein AidB-like acyl-CoA dehydrogenase
VFGYTRLMVAAFGLGAGQAALAKAIDYSKQRKQFGTYLAEKQGFTHKLLVPNSVRLAAAQAYIEYVADLLTARTGPLWRAPWPSCSPPRQGTWPPTTPCRRWAGTATAWTSRWRRSGATRAS